MNGKLAIVQNGVAESDGGETIRLMDEGVVIRTFRISPCFMVHACTFCHTAPKKIQFCAKCRMAGYCGTEWQKHYWERHKVDCKALNHLREVSKDRLYIAACNGRVADVEALVDGGVDVNKAKSDGSTSVQLASQQNHF